MKYLLPFLIFTTFSIARINFVHIPKTGGTTFDALLKYNFPLEEIYPHISVGGPTVF